MVDNIDLKILSFLEENSRYSYAEIGRMITLSSSAVRERIQKMEDCGIIEKFSIKLNYKLLGNGIEAFVLVKAYDGKLRNFLKVVKDFPEVKEAFRITGEQNVHLKVVLKDMDHLQGLLDRILVYGDTQTLLTTKL